jgi:hypothetical protein
VRVVDGARLLPIKPMQSYGTILGAIAGPVETRAALA